MQSRQRGGFGFRFAFLSGLALLVGVCASLAIAAAAALPFFKKKRILSLNTRISSRWKRLKWLRDRRNSISQNDLAGRSFFRELSPQPHIWYGLSIRMKAHSRNLPSCRFSILVVMSRNQGQNGYIQENHSPMMDSSPVRNANT